MRKIAIFVILMVGIFALSAMMVTAEEKAHEYVGAKKCKACHKAIFKAWEATGHATSFDKLSDEEKKKPECIECHSTGTSVKGVFLEGVQCESCHGAGKDYKSAKIMSKKKWKADPEAHKKMAIDAGLLYPVEVDCVRCHKKEGNANYVEFVYEKRKGDSHPVVKEDKK